MVKSVELRRDPRDRDVDVLLSATLHRFVDGEVHARTGGHENLRRCPGGTLRLWLCLLRRLPDQLAHVGGIRSGVGGLLRSSGGGDCRRDTHTYPERCGLTQESLQEIARYTD